MVLKMEKKGPSSPFCCRGGDIYARFIPGGGYHIFISCLAFSYMYGSTLCRYLPQLYAHPNGPQSGKMPIVPILFPRGGMYARVIPGGDTV